MCDFFSARPQRRTNSGADQVSDTEGEQLVLLAESTLDSAEKMGKQANSAPQNYISIRITLVHEQWYRIEECVSDAKWYIAYLHFGKNGNNPHFHVSLPGGKGELEKYRQRFKGAHFHVFTLYTGMECAYSIWTSGSHFPTISQCAVRLTWGNEECVA